MEKFKPNSTAYPKKVAEEVNRNYGEEYQQVVSVVDGKNVYNKMKNKHIETEDEQEKYDEGYDYLQRR